MKCFICGANMVRVKTSFKATWGECELEITGVKPFRCAECGNEVFSPEDSEKIQEKVRLIQ